VTISTAPFAPLYVWYLRAPVVAWFDNRAAVNKSFEHVAVDGERTGVSVPLDSGGEQNVVVEHILCCHHHGKSDALSVAVEAVSHCSLWMMRMSGATGLWLPSFEVQAQQQVAFVWQKQEDPLQITFPNSYTNRRDYVFEFSIPRGMGDSTALCDPCVCDWF